MYNGFGGGYGGYGVGGQGGMEMYMIIICCCCCLCIASVVGGWYSNVFCSVSSSMGRSCQADVPEPAPLEEPEPMPESSPSSMLTACSESWNRVNRDKNDPRPPIRAEACQDQTRTLGRDCYFWEVQADKLTGMARWMRKPDPEDSGADMRTGNTCQPAVKCKTVLDPATLEQYTDSNPAALLKQCTAVGPYATNKDAAIKELTNQAKKIQQWTGTSVWNDTNSRIWYVKMQRYIGQRDLVPYYNNALLAVKNFQRKIGSNALRKTTLAYVLEATIRAPDNRSDWIVSVTNKFINTLNTNSRRSSAAYEAAYVAYLKQFFTKMTAWEATIDNAFMM